MAILIWKLMINRSTIKFGFFPSIFKQNHGDDLRPAACTPRPFLAVQVIGSSTRTIGLANKWANWAMAITVNYEAMDSRVLHGS